MANPITVHQFKKEEIMQVAIIFLTLGFFQLCHNVKAHNSSLTEIG